MTNTSYPEGHFLARAVAHRRGSSVTDFWESADPKKSENKFTKVKVDRRADAVLKRYFADNLADIEEWFIVISPADHSIAELKTEINALSMKNWKEIHV